MKAHALALIACALFATVAFAHNGEEHVIGTVVTVATSSITVKTIDNKIVTVAVLPETKFIESQTAAKIDALKIGYRVVIHAKEPTDGNLVADTVEFAATPQSAPTQGGVVQSFTGVVSDSTCGATHSMKGMSAADCTGMCIKMGRRYVLVVGSDVYALRGHEVELKKFAGTSVTVRGSVNSKNVTVDSVVAQRQS